MIKTGIVGFQQLRNHSGDHAKCGEEDHNAFVFALRCGSMQVQKQDHQEGQHRKIMEGYCVKIQIIHKEILDIACTVDQAGVDRGKRENGATHSSSDCPNAGRVFSVIESHERECEQNQGAEVQRNMVQIIPP